MARRYLETGGGRPKNNLTEENYIAHESSNIYEADTHWTSWLVPMWWLLILLFFVISVDLNNCLKNNFGPQCGCVAKFLRGFSFEPMQENSLLSLTEMGALGWDSARNRHQGWRLDTCIWLYAGIIHLLAIMLSLVFIGIRLEQQFGSRRIGVIYW
ncbi:RHOMBOID-like protein 2 [Vigna radiata var. radiata]|uniref:RHOMBOID-like protein n=1 Tax=Vigna radiata var. radiata TaxID=3916 RepID=A0A1S3UAQ2_VIGRR|nr:RHOMBOID-like protein 2 [Vigna radiata var. radiata]